eukprot:495971-Amphidinium_carterae.1
MHSNAARQSAPDSSQKQFPIAVIVATSEGKLLLIRASYPLSCRFCDKRRPTSATAAATESKSHAVLACLVKVLPDDAHVLKAFVQVCSAESPREANATRRKERGVKGYSPKLEKKLQSKQTLLRYVFYLFRMNFLKWCGFELKF